MLIRNLAGIFSGQGFADSEGRHPRIEQADFHQGPVDILVCDHSRRVRAIGQKLTVGSEDRVLDAAGKVALPAFVDSHTHAAFWGSRAFEFFRRWEGESYAAIARAGGGIEVTQQATNEISDLALVNVLAERMRKTFASGTAVIEVKSGYGRNAAEELRLLKLIREAAALVPEIKVVPTFLGLHAIPRGRQEAEFVDEMIGLLPELKRQGLAMFADSFPERGFFSVGEALRFSAAARTGGLGLKAHADELTDSGGALPFIEQGATSIDHLQFICDAAVQALGTSPTVATLLPATSFFLAQPYANARKLTAAGAKVALATDYNPGTAPTSSMQFTALLAAANLRMTAAEILCAMTYNGACAVEASADYGSLAAGKVGAVLLFDIGSQENGFRQELLEHIVLGAGQLTPAPLCQASKLEPSPC